MNGCVGLALVRYDGTTWDIGRIQQEIREFSLALSLDLAAIKDDLSD
jgi:hypothetical protein